MTCQDWMIRAKSGAVGRVEQQLLGKSLGAFSWLPQVLEYWPLMASPHCFVNRGPHAQLSQAILPHLHAPSRTVSSDTAFTEVPVTGSDPSTGLRPRAGSHWVAETRAVTAGESAGPHPLFPDHHLILPHHLTSPTPTMSSCSCDCGAAALFVRGPSRGTASLLRKRIRSSADFSSGANVRTYPPGWHEWNFASRPAAIRWECCHVEDRLKNLRPIGDHNSGRSVPICPGMALTYPPSNVIG